MKKYILDAGHHRKAIPEKGKYKVRATFALIIVLRVFPGFNLEGGESKWSSALVSLSAGHTANTPGRPRLPEPAQQRTGEETYAESAPQSCERPPLKYIACDATDWHMHVMQSWERVLCKERRAQRPALTKGQINARPSIQTRKT